MKHINDFCLRCDLTKKSSVVKWVKVLLGVWIIIVIPLQLRVRELDEVVTVVCCYHRWDSLYKIVNVH